MVQILPQRDIGGDIGKALGGGLSEGFSKAFQSGRLANAFEKFQKTKNVSDFLREPGAAEALPFFGPYIQRTIERSGKGPATATTETPKEPQQAMSTEGGLPGPTKLEEFGTAKENVPEMKKPTGKLFEPSHILAEKGKNILKSPGSSDIDREMEKLDKDPRYSFLNTQELRNQAEKNVDKNYAAQQANIARGVTELEEGVSNMLQQAGFKDYSKLEGNILDRVKEKMKADMAEGQTYEQSWNNMRDSLGDVVRTLTNLRGGPRWGPKAETDIKTAYKEFEKLGLEDRFPAHAAQIFDIPVITASQIVEPVKNPEFKKTVPKVYSTNADYEKMAKTIKPEDNIASMMDYLDDKGFSISKFKNAIINDKKIYKSLTRRQEQELLNSSLGNFDAMNKNFFRTVGR